VEAAAADLDAIEAGEHHIEDDEVGAGSAGEAERGGAVEGALLAEALGAEVAGDQIDDGLLIVYYKDRRCIHRSISLLHGC